MAFHLTVAYGMEAGKTYEINDGESCMVGRADSAQLQLDDEAVSWEHAVFHCEAGRLYVENLSALGTQLNGQKVSTRTRVNIGDRVELAPNAVVDVQGDDPSGSSATMLTVALVGFIIVVGGLGLAGTIAYKAFFDKPAATGPIVTQGNWEQAFQRLDRRLTDWVSRGLYPSEDQEILRNAWRAERLKQPKPAHDDYTTIAARLMIQPAPGKSGKSMTEVASPNNHPLGVIMGIHPNDSPDSDEWQGDDTYVSALVWFVRERMKRTTADATGAGGPGLGL